MMNARFTNPGYPFTVVSRPSLYTTNNSLAGRYSQRKRALVLKVCVLDEYCVNALANIRAVNV